jgi:hypothetical protein
MRSGSRTSDQPAATYRLALMLYQTRSVKQAIIAEVERLKETLDSISDLSLAEGVFQVTQGNYERAAQRSKRFRRKCSA